MVDLVMPTAPVDVILAIDLRLELARRVANRFRVALLADQRCVSGRDRAGRKPRVWSDGRVGGRSRRGEHHHRDEGTEGRADHCAGAVSTASSSDASSIFGVLTRVLMG